MRKAIKKAITKAKSAVATEPPKKAAKKTAAKKAAAPKRAAATSGDKTKVVANVDVGFGNMLYLRGDAPGLSWAKGVPMDCVSSNEWSLGMVGVKQPFEYKLLVNDIHWDVGSNSVAKPGKVNVAEPAF